jgi:DNA ligase-1
LTLLADVVEASRLVTATSSRSRKIAILAELLSAVQADEVAICVGFLSGLPRQGRVGVGYATVYGPEVQPAGEPSLTVGDVDRVISEIEAASGSGSNLRRRGSLEALLAGATKHEADFLKRC